MVGDAEKDVNVVLRLAGENMRSPLFHIVGNKRGWKCWHDIIAFTMLLRLSFLSRPKGSRGVGSGAAKEATLTVGVSVQGSLF